jgi:hypothetical protein
MADAQPAGDATADADTTADAGAYPCSSAILCDDFEHGFLQQLWNLADSPGGTASIDSTSVAAYGHGSLAVQAVPVDGGSSSAAVRAYQALPASQAAYLRFFMRIAPGGDAQNSSATIDLAQLVQNADPFNSVDLRLTGAPGSRSLGIGNGQTNVFLASATPYPFGKWNCIEWEVGPDSMHVWIDGTELTDLQTSNDPTPPALGQEIFGVSYFGAVTAHDWWYDEVIVDTSRIGCDRFQAL